MQVGLGVPDGLQSQRVDLQEALVFVLLLSLQDLGAEYRTYFQDARFAHHGGLPGTRKRLDAWFATLAAIANEGQLRNDLLALLLDQLEAPIPQKVSEEIEQLRTELQNAAKVTNPDDEIRIEQHLPEPEVARPHIAVEHLVVAL
eukprot:g27181.t1